MFVFTRRSSPVPERAVEDGPRLIVQARSYPCPSVSPRPAFSSLYTSVEEVLWGRPFCGCLDSLAALQEAIVVFRQKNCLAREVTWDDKPLSWVL